jgi:small subunit ribosomal protein S20
MAHSKQAEKRNRQNQEARAANKTTRSSMKSAMKRVIGAKDGTAARDGLAQAMKKVDKAAKHGVIHKNAAARYKSQLSRAATKAK